MNDSTMKFLRFGILDFLFWGYFAAIIGFITTYFLECGMSSSMMSLVVAAYMLAAFLGAFFWGSLSDRKRSCKKIFIPGLILMTVLCIAEFYLVKISIWYAAILHPLVGFVTPPLGSLLDAWMLRSFDHDAASFGRARGLGSSGYAVAMLVLGQVYAILGFGAVPFASLAIFLVILIMAWKTEEKPFETVKRERKQGGVKELARVRPYAFLITVLFLTGLSIAPVNNLKIVILESIGGDVSILGIDSFIGVMVQAMFIFISGNLRVIPSKLRMLLTTVFASVMLACTWFAQSPVLFIIGTLFMNISYGLMLPTMREITEKNVPDHLKNTAHSLTDAVYGSFSAVLALLYSGMMMDTFGPKSVALLGMGIMVIPVMMCLFDLLKKNA